MVKRLSIVGSLVVASLAGFALAPSALAQNKTDRVLEVYGNDKCPSGTICVRKGESERFRIPKNLRDSTPIEGNETWAYRQKELAGAGAGGTGSCTSTGPGGWTGCWSQQMRDAKAERRAAKQEAASTP